MGIVALLVKNAAPLVNMQSYPAKCLILLDEIDKTPFPPTL